MLYAADTHALAWWMDNDPRLSKVAEDALDDGSGPLLIPALVLAELIYMGSRRGDTDRVRKAVHHFRDSANCLILPFGNAELDFISFDLDIHDSVIVSSIRSYALEHNEQVILITRDERISASGLVETLW